MLKITKKHILNLKILRFLIIPTILVLTPFFNNIQNAQARLEFQWNQDDTYRRLKWFQKENKRKFRNKIYFFLRPSDRRSDLLKINLAIPKPFKSTLNNDKISFCKVKIGGFEGNTKCLENIPADFEIKTDESGLRSLDIYPYNPILSNKENYAIVLKVFNPKNQVYINFIHMGNLKGNHFQVI